MFPLKSLVALSCLCAHFALADITFAAEKKRSHASVVTQPASKKSLPVDKIVGRAHQLIGTPYRWGGSSVSGGFDCSGLMVYLFRSEAGIQLPRTTVSMMQHKGTKVARTQLKPGDAVFFKHNGRKLVNHVGVYIGGNRFIHAPSSGKSIRIDSLKNVYWNKNYVAAKRF